MNRRSHSEWYSTVTRLRSQLAAEPGNSELPKSVWALLGSSGFDVRTGRLLVDTFRQSAFSSTDSLEFLVSEFRKLTDETSEQPTSAFIDPLLENLIRQHSPRSRNGDDFRWLLEALDIN